MLHVAEAVNSLVSYPFREFVFSWKLGGYHRGPYTCFVLVIKLGGWATSVIKKLNALELRDAFSQWCWPDCAEQEGKFQLREVFKV